MSLIKKKKTGILGGTFDPVHIGHLILGEEAYRQLQLDEVLFMPAGNPPHKQYRPGRASDPQRVEMVRRAIRMNPHFSFSSIEMELDGPSYTYRTLELLKDREPDTSFYLIVGEDSLRDFDTWREPARIAALCTIAAGIRPNSGVREFKHLAHMLQEKYHSDFVTLENPEVDISSSRLREWRKNGRSLRYYVPDEVLQFIEEEHLYMEQGAVLCSEK